MQETKGRLPCLANPLRICDCPLRRVNAKFMNELGRRRDVINTFNHLGYDNNGALGVIMGLLRDPHGGYYTTAFEEIYPFGSDVIKVRNWLRRTCIQQLIIWEDDPSNIRCSEINDVIRTNNYDPAWYLNWLRSEYFKGQDYEVDGYDDSTK